MYHPNYSPEYGCYWHEADREGEENSVGGDGCRPVSNSVMCVLFKSSSTPPFHHLSPPAEFVAIVDTHHGHARTRSHPHNASQYQRVRECGHLVHVRAPTCVAVVTLP
jgi:hypothetical protein